MRHFGFRRRTTWLGLVAVGAAAAVAVGARAGAAQPTLGLSISPSTTITSGLAALATAKYSNSTGGTTTRTTVVFTFTPAVPVLAASAGCTPTSGEAVSTVTCDLGNVQGGTPPIPVRVRFTVNADVTVSARAAWAEMGPGGPSKNVNSVIPSNPASILVAATTSGPDRRESCATGAVSTAAVSESNIVATTVTPSGFDASALCNPIRIAESNIVAKSTTGQAIACDGGSCTTAPSYVSFVGPGTVRLLFLYPPPGSAPNPKFFNLYVLDDENDQTATLVSAFCGSPAVPLCRYPAVKLDNRTIQVDVVVDGGAGVDPGFIG